MDQPFQLFALDLSRFSGATQVTVGGKSAAFVVNSPTSIVAIVPAGLAGAANVAVTTPNGTSAAGTGSAVTLDAIPLPLTTTSIPRPTGAEKPSANESEGF